MILQDDFTIIHIPRMKSEYSPTNQSNGVDWWRNKTKNDFPTQLHHVGLKLHYVQPKWRIKQAHLNDRTATLASKSAFVWTAVTFTTNILPSVVGSYSIATNGRCINNIMFINSSNMYGSLAAKEERIISLPYHTNHHVNFRKTNHITPLHATPLRNTTPTTHRHNRP